MNVYRITRYPGDMPAYAGTLAESKPLAVCDMHRRMLTDTRVNLIDVSTDKPGILALLNNVPHWAATARVLKTWKVSPRGALIETTPGE